ncbi:hypothetical protein [Synechococcus sp. PCC 7336]|uniref:hypothetical protein n=1 Tax=Synechococcus sp. PCC 7336 TaxID=195250 RepID=UPI000347AA77|nr:hypothetical protein [Synechococcus sp. PCC 7336]
MRIDAAGARKVETLTPAKTFFLQQFADPTRQLNVADAEVQHQLVEWVRSADSGSELSEADLGRREFAEICLRCFISNVIEQVCVQLESQFGTKHGFSRYDLFPFVLDEGNPLKRSRQSRSGTYRSSIGEILQTFDPSRGGLATWTVRLVRRNRSLNAYLLECGVYLISDWAILNDTSLPQARRILSEFHTLTAVEIRDACQLLESYHAVYRRDRLEQRRTGSAGRCQQPSNAQLAEMARYAIGPGALGRAVEPERAIALPAKVETDPERLLSQLQRLAERLRQYRIYVRGGPAPVESLDRDSSHSGRSALQVAAPDEDLPEREDRNEFLTYYRAQFSRCLDRAISDTVERWVTQLQRKKTPKHQPFLLGLSLFHCQGMSMGDIAPHVGLRAQYQVSRLLKLKELRADIRQALLLELRNCILQKLESYKELEQLQEWDRKLDAALSEQIDEMLQEAAAEASVAQHSPARSLYARRLCQYLDSRGAE